MLLMEILILIVVLIGVAITATLLHIITQYDKSTLYAKIFDKSTYRAYRYVLDNIDEAIYEYSFDDVHTFLLDKYTIKVYKIEDKHYSSIFLNDRKCVMGFYYEFMSTNLANKLLKLVDSFEPSTESDIIDETVAGEIYYAIDKTNPYGYWLFQAGGKSLLDSTSCVCFYRATHRCSYKSFTPGSLMDMKELQSLRKATSEEVERFYKEYDVKLDRIDPDRELIEAGEKEFKARFEFMNIRTSGSDTFTSIVALIHQIPGLGRDGNQYFTLVTPESDEPIPNSEISYIMEEIDHYADCNYRVYEVFLANQDTLEDAIQIVKESAVKCNKLLQESGDLKVYKPLSDEY